MIANGIRAFCNWWFLELYALVPNWIRRVCLRRRHCLVGVLKRTEFALSAITGRHEEQLLRITSNASEPAGDLSAALRQIKRRRQAVTLRLCRELGLRKLLNLPLAARDDLDHLLRYEMDRLSPFGPDNVYFAYRVVAVDREQRGILVEVEIAPRRIVDRAVAIAQRLGLQPRRLELAGGTSDGALNLLPRQGSVSSRMGRLDLALAVLALAAAAAAMVLPLHKQYVTAADLDQKAVSARYEAEKGLALRQELENVTSTINFIFGHRRTTIMMTRVLAELTHVIPDEAYVVQLHVNDGEVRIQGYAQSVSDLIRSLEHSPLFWKAEFVSPITPDPHNGGERFQIAVTIHPTDG